MSKTKFIKINSISLEDANDMFDAICTDIIGVTPFEGRKKIIGISGKDDQVKRHKVTIGQLMEVVKRYELVCEVKITYIDQSVPDDPIMLPKSDNEGLTKDLMLRDLENQKKDITNPELKDIPDIPDFL